MRLKKTGMRSQWAGGGQYACALGRDEQVRGCKKGREEKGCVWASC